MAYTKTNWVNNQSPPINATNLNKIEQGIFDCDENSTEALVNANDAITRVAACEADIAELTELSYTGETSKSTLMNWVYPVGSVYQSISSVNPGDNTVFGVGTWELLDEGKFLVSASASGTYTPESTGGKRSHELTSYNLRGTVAQIAPNTASSTKQILTGNPSVSNYNLAVGSYGIMPTSEYYHRIDETGAHIVDGHYAQDPVPTIPPYYAVYTWIRTA